MKQAPRTNVMDIKTTPVLALIETALLTAVAVSLSRKLGLLDPVLATSNKSSASVSVVSGEGRVITDCVVPTFRRAVLTYMGGRPAEQLTASLARCIGLFNWSGWTSQCSGGHPCPCFWSYDASSSSSVKVRRVQVAGPRTELSLWSRFVGSKSFSTCLTGTRRLRYLFIALARACRFNTGRGQFGRSAFKLNITVSAHDNDSYSWFRHGISITQQRLKWL